MGERILEIVIYFMRHLEENNGRLDGLKQMAEDLRSQGFTDNEINSAYLWVLEQFYQPEFVVEGKKTNYSGSYHRILSDYERDHFTTNGYGTLIQMRKLGVIDDNQIEMIIERAILGPNGKLGAAAVRNLAWSFLVDSAQEGLSDFDIYGTEQNGDLKVN